MHNVPQLAKLLLLTLLTLACLGGVVYGLYFFGNSSQELAQEGRFEVYERFANRYFAQLQFYSGVCDDMKPASTATCEDADEGFRVYERSATGLYHCTDAGGYQGEVKSIPRDSLWCS